MLSLGEKRGEIRINVYIFTYIRLKKYWKNALENNESGHLRLGV